MKYLINIILIYLCISFANRESGLQYFNNRLFWLDTHRRLMVSDLSWEYPSLVSDVSGIADFKVVHPKLRTLPGKFTIWNFV